MARKLDLQEILKKNPHIDPKKLAEAGKLTGQLRKLRLSKRGYRIPSPVTRRRVTTEVSEEFDPRTVQLYQR